jgi:arabinofuranosyltransferase
MKDNVDEWRTQVYQLSSMGAWVNRALPDGTVVSTYANGALSYEAGPKLIVVDQLGLTDEHIARRGKRAVGAAVGHAAHDYDYIVNVRKPDVLFARGGGFAPARVCDRSRELAGHYRSVVFQVKDRPLWAPVYLRTERADELIAMLDADSQFDHVPCP